MKKHSFSKWELIQFYRILASEKLIPCDKIEISTDKINGGIGNVCTAIKFVKGKKQLNVGLVTKTYPENDKLKGQLLNFLGGEE